MDTPTYHNVVAGPEGYHFGEPDRRASWEAEGQPVVQVLQLIGGRFIPTPARYRADAIAELADGVSLAIDFGQSWSLGVADTAAFREYARSLLIAA